MTDTFFRRLAPLALLGAGTALTGCEGDMEINGQKGVPLAEVELAGPPPIEVVLASGDTVIVRDGTTFTITAEGADADSLRFVRDERTIGITREEAFDGNGSATITITMPPPEELVIAGSGTIRAQSLADDSEISIGGSGAVEFTKIAARKLAINIGGSGAVKGAGTAQVLEINIGGSGDIELGGLKAERADVSIGGAGDVAFASDGEVEANIAGSGDVNVAGSAKCTVSAFGSGTLSCAPVKVSASPAPATLPAPQSAE